MHTLLFLAAEGGEKTLWDPTIIGVLTVLSAIGLFCGSVYLLLSTNLGARLGFLVAGAALTGFIVLLSGLWITTATPLNSPKGRPPGWKVKEIVTDPSQSSIPGARDILQEGRQQNTEDLARLRPAVEGALVTQQTPANEEPPEQPLAAFNTSTDLLTDFPGFESFVIGGESKMWVFHQNKYAAVQFCTKRAVVIPPGGKPPVPECDPLEPKQFAIMEYDFGSIRQPPWVYFGFSLTLFALFVLGLHWYEQDARERTKASASLRPVPTA